jgi:hypothetical protein
VPGCADPHHQWLRWEGPTLPVVQCAARAAGLVHLGCGADRQARRWDLHVLPTRAALPTFQLQLLTPRGGTAAHEGSPATGIRQRERPHDAGRPQRRKPQPSRRLGGVVTHAHVYAFPPHPPARVATARSPPIRPTGTRSPGRGDRQGRAVTRANRYSAGPVLAGFVLSLSVAARQRPGGRNPHHESTGPSWKGATPRRATWAGR